MYNIFDMLPESFFNLFNTTNKRVISDCLYLAYQSFHNDLSFSILKEDLLYIFQDYFDTHLTHIEEEELLTSRDKALYILRRLKECGWINEEHGENYQVYINFEDYTMKILNNLFTLDNESDAQYSGVIYGIYVSFMNFDVNHGDIVFETVYENTKALADKLKNLNSNIKKYIQRLLNEGIKDNLDELLTSLLEDYQIKIIDRAYYNLTTYDNPSKYRQRIIEAITSILDNDKNIDIIVRNIMERKEIQYNEAYDLLMKQSDYIMNSFENIEDIMQEIERKNSKFVESAIHRINFLLNNQKDVEGKINNIIKNINDYYISDVGNIYLNQIADQKSLYVPRTYIKPIQSIIENNIELDIERKDEILNQIEKSINYSHKYIEDKVLKMIEDKGEFLGSSLPIHNNDDLTTFVLIYLYGFSYNSRYSIEPTDDIVTMQNYRFRDFKVKEKKGE